MRGVWLGLALALIPVSAPADEEVLPGRPRVVLVEGWGEVKIDGRWRGLAPVEAVLPAGTYRVEVPETTWHLGWEGDVVVPGGDELLLYVRVRPKVSVVRLRGFPDEAQIQVNGLELGSVRDRSEIRMVSDGVYDVDVLIDGVRIATERYERCVRRGCLLPGETTELSWPQADSSRKP